MRNCAQVTGFKSSVNQFECGKRRVVFLALLSGCKCLFTPISCVPLAFTPSDAHSPLRFNNIAMGSLWPYLLPGKPFFHADKNVPYHHALTRCPAPKGSHTFQDQRG